MWDRLVFSKVRPQPLMSSKLSLFWKRQKNKEKLSSTTTSKEPLTPRIIRNYLTKCYPKEALIPKLYIGYNGCIIKLEWIKDKLTMGACKEANYLQCSSSITWNMYWMKLKSGNQSFNMKFLCMLMTYS